MNIRGKPVATKKKISKKKVSKKKTAKKKTKKTAKKKARKKQSKKQPKKPKKPKKPKVSSDPVDEAKSVGRPRVIATPEEMDKLIDGYIKICKDARPPEPLTLTGMILALGLSSRESFDHYKTYGDEFSDSVKRGKLFIEHGYELRLHGTVATGSIFALKNFGWTDKPPEEIKSEQDLADAISELSQKLPT